MDNNQWNNIEVGDKIQVVIKKRTGAFAYIVTSRVIKKTDDEILLFNEECVTKEDYLLKQTRRLFKSKTNSFNPYRGKFPEIIE